MALYHFEMPGSLPSGEVFQFGFYMEGAGTSAASMVDAADIWLGGLLDASAGTPGSWTTGTAFGPPKVSGIEVATGNVIDTAFGNFTGAGTNSSETPLPPQCAIVVTLRTALAGGSHRGRFYLPAPRSGALTSNGRLAASTATAIAGAVASAFTLAEGTPPLTDVVVYSRKLHSTQIVTSGEIGDVFDTQRRRRDKLAEARHGFSV